MFSNRQSTDRTYQIIGILALVAVILFLVYKIVNIKLIEKKTTIENNIIFGKLREAAKLVIWEQDFQLSNVTTAEKKYFDSDWLKFTEQVSTTAHGRIGFHIDLADSVNTTFVMTQKGVEIHAPLRLTYVTIDNSTIQQIKDASYDPTLEVSKEDAIKRLNEVALREFMQPAVNKAKQESLEKQEKSLSALVGKPVKIYLTDMPSLKEGLKWLEMK